MGIHREIGLLEPTLKKRVEKTLIALENANIPVLISETLRDLEVQQAYYAQGRESLLAVNQLREKCGLYLINAEENKRTVTNCDGIKYKSNHQTRDENGYGYAIDIVPAKYDSRGNKSFWWTAPQEVWESIGKIAEDNGLDWCYGGKGEHWGWDSPHFELLKEYEEKEEKI